MRLVLIIVICLQLFVEEGYSLAVNSQRSSTDPCDDSPCGKGAECKSMGSIAICVCPNDGTGDPFVSCMQKVEDEAASSTTPSSSVLSNQFVTSFDVGSIHHQSRATSTVKSTTTKSLSTVPPTATTLRTTAYSTSTMNPYEHGYKSSTFRPATIGNGHYSTNDNRNQPESHRVPIISHSPSVNYNYPTHGYPPRPLNSEGSSTTSPTYPYRGSSTSYDPFHEKTVAPSIADYVRGGQSSTTPYIYRGTASHLSGSNNAHEYDSKPITPTTAAYHYSPYSNSVNRFGHHGHHPSSSGFPGPITESSASYSSYRHGSSTSHGGVGSFATGSTYDIYNYNPLRNDEISSQSHYPAAFERIPDPHGKYDNCRTYNGVIVCADKQHHSHNPPPLHDQNEMRTSTVNDYGFLSNRDQDHYHTSYPSRHGSSTSLRPISDYAYDVKRQGYPYQYDTRPQVDAHPIGSESSDYYPHSYLPKEQRISAQSTLKIISTPAVTSSLTEKNTGRNDNQHPLCKSMCGVNSICRLVLERPVCGCPEGHTGDASVRCSPITGGGGENGFPREQCQQHVDCRESEICAKRKCIDPCKEQGLMSSSSVNFIGVGAGGRDTICGSHAECLVVEHTPVCKCHQGYFGNPYVACVS